MGCSNERLTPTPTQLFELRNQTLPQFSNAPNKMLVMQKIPTSSETQQNQKYCLLDLGLVA